MWLPDDAVGKAPAEVAPVSIPGGARVAVDPLGERKPPGFTRFVCFSDTHGLHDQIPAAHRPSADILLHAGDFTNTGELDQVKSFDSWLQHYPARHKVVIAGNHDITFEPDYYHFHWQRFHRKPYDCEEVRRVLLESGNCIYLQDSATEIFDFKIYGSPWQPEFCDWAFNLRQGEPLRAQWERIPADVDVLLTHGPPYGVGDLCSHGGRAGCRELLQAIHARAVPVHLSGHIHEGYGVVSDGTTMFVNACTCTEQYRPINAPIVLDVPPAIELQEAAAHRQALAGDLLNLHRDISTSLERSEVV
mmetsp:Transcript_18209/g.35718  ORF Transcript_18209/g.35718 Transcript_18209/m.35718 type:complete len:304 (-) Transcript_18209:84-995(-)